MSAIDLNDYVAAGYFITKYSTEGFWKSPLMPERVISLSNCIGKTVMVYWDWDVEMHREEILDFGIPIEKFSAFQKWSARADTEKGVVYPNVFHHLEDARQFITDFVPAQDDLFLIGAALPKALADSLLADGQRITRSVNKQPDSFFITYGVSQALTDKREIESSGEVLGYEIVSYDMGYLGHSWLCSNLEKDMNDLFGIHPNQYGLIETYEEAKKVYDWIAEDEMKGHRAEPEPYYPWLLVRYPANP